MVSEVMNLQIPVQDDSVDQQHHPSDLWTAVKDGNPQPSCRLQQYQFSVNIYFIMAIFENITTVDIHKKNTLKPKVHGHILTGT